MRNTLGALLGVAVVAAIPGIFFGSILVFYAVFAIGCLVSLPIALITDAVQNARDRREYAADARQATTNEHLKVLAAIHKQVPADNRVLNIDCRQVHYHQDK